METKILRISSERKAEPSSLWVGNENDHEVLQVKFELPESLDNATILLHLRAEGYKEDIELEAARTWVVERKHTQHTGTWNAWIEGLLPNGAVWNSDPFKMKIAATLSESL